MTRDQSPATRLRGPAGLAMIWAAVATAAVGGVLALRLALIQVFTAWNDWQFALRPELENWTLPGYEVEAPATAWAVIVVSLALAGSSVIRRSRRRGAALTDARRSS